jgi:hypothetical protein
MEENKRQDSVVYGRQSDRLADSAEQAIPREAPNVIKWAEESVIFPGSARAKNFKISITPWIREPLERMCHELSVRSVTLMKPVQSGGSAFGEVLLLYWLRFAYGILQYNWSNDKRAEQRWDSRVEGILKACLVVAEMLEHAQLLKKGEINFGRIYFRNQGTFSSDNLDSDSIRLQINEEVHAWESGHLAKAEGRSTAVWDYKRANISNAGMKGDQLDEAFSKKGTAQHWEIRCPHCSTPLRAVFHRMRTRWEERHPHLGGLRYDADKARIGRYEYNYNKIRPTIRYQMPCGGFVHNEDLVMRRRLSLSGRYSEPTNLAAETIHRSYTYQAVSVDFIDWMVLIQEKHAALRARALGDPLPWVKYVQERECVPYSPDDAPVEGIIELVKGLKKNRAGLFGKKLRLFSLDRQRGERAKMELPHWWLVIRDVQVAKGRLVSLLVFEGKVESDDDVIRILEEHKCQMWQGVADSGDDTTHVYVFCLKHGINCIKGGNEELYTHEGGARRVFSTERPLHAMIGRAPKFPYVAVNDGGTTRNMPDPREPMFFLYSKVGIRERLHFLMTDTDYRTPDDVSEDYHKHMEAEERIEERKEGAAPVVRWVQRKDRNDLFVCECYIALQIDQAGAVIANWERE